MKAMKNEVVKNQKINCNDSETGMEFEAKRFLMELLVASGLVILSLLGRIIPHFDNFTPLLGVALFSGAFLRNRTLAFFVPVVSVLLSDIWLGWHETFGFVYAGLILLTFLGRTQLDTKKSPFFHMGLNSLLGAVIFFLVSNFGVWSTQNIYEKSLVGLVNCYVAGLPFFPNTLASSFIYSMGLSLVSYFLIHRTSSQAEGRI
ncbi:MAG: hypothetical protein K1X29_02820 [Bdellovibrionales bacterium]|nr:hypothetical protein [Bdellovibrionales bacterium]